MRLLFDQNLSFRLCKLPSDIFPGSEHVRRLGLSEADDIAVWRHAGDNGFMLVSHDADFADLAALRGAPPKVICLRRGNRPTSAIAELLRDHSDAVLAFEQSEESVCYEIY